MGSSSFVKVLKKIITSEINKKQGIAVYQVTGIAEELIDGGGRILQYKVNIKHPNLKLQYDNVPIVGLGLGHFKGLYKFPNAGDFVLVAFLAETTPIIIGTLHDIFSEIVDEIPLIKLKELFLTNQERGAIFYMNEDNEIIVTTGNSNTETFPKIKFKKDKNIEITTDGTSKVTIKPTGEILIDGDTIQITSGTNKFIREGDNVTVGAETGSLVLNSSGGKLQGGN